MKCIRPLALRKSITRGDNRGSFVCAACIKKNKRRQGDGEKRSEAELIEREEKRQEEEEKAFRFALGEMVKEEFHALQEEQDGRGKKKKKGEYCEHYNFIFEL